MKKLSFALLLAACGSTYADISVNPLWITLQPGGQNSNFSTITVTNTDSTTAYVKTTVAKIEQIGNPDSPTDIFEKGESLQNFGLIASPSKFAIPPKSSASMRVSNINKNVNADALYTILFTPVTNPSASSAADADAPTHPTMNVHVILSYQIHVLVIPENVTMKVCAKANGTAATITNSGDTLIKLVNGKICDTSGNNCTQFPQYNYTSIPAGQTFNITLPKSGTLTYEGYYGQDKMLPISTSTPC